jgi:hypothetical protein
VNGVEVVSDTDVHSKNHDVIIFPLIGKTVVGQILEIYLL